MENQETKKELSIVELKKQHWKSIKKEFIDKIPKQFKVDVDGIDDDSVYYHPKIILNNELSIYCQCDLKNNNVYGATLKSNTQITSGHYVYTINLYINDDEHFKYVLNNYLKIEEKINSAMKEIQKIYELMNSLQTVVNNISSTFIEEIIDQHKLKQSIRSLEEVTEYLENQRY